MEFTNYAFTRNLKSGPATYRLIYDFYQFFKTKDNLNVFIDLSTITWIDANLCALFDAVLYILQRDYNHQFFLDPHDVENRFDVFNRNGFLKEKGQKLIIDDRQSTVCLTRFNSDESEDFFNYIEQDLLNHRAFKNNPEISDQLLGHFLEIYANIQLHARSNEPVFACGQYFPKLKLLHFSLVDIGIGFMDLIFEFTRGEIDSPKDAIQWAIKGNSSKKDAPGGFGLSKLREYCEKSNHGFHIVTNGQFWGNNCGINQFWEMNEFPGAFINLGFNCG